MSDTARSAPFGAALRQRRLTAGLSLNDLARRVHYSKSHLSKVETGRKGPSPDLARRCDAALNADGRLAALVPTVAATPSLPAESSPDDRWTISVDKAGRGGFGATIHDAAMAGNVSPLTWNLPPTVTAPRNAIEAIKAFRTMFDQMRRVGHATSPAVLLPVLIAQTHALRLLAVSADAVARIEALFLASRYAEYTGWLAQEAGDDRGALWWTERAVGFATACGDQELAAYALVRRGLVALYRYDAHEAIAVAERAQVAGCGPRVRGLAALREAQGHALAGDYDRCRRTLDRAPALLQAAESTSDGRPLLGTTTVADPVAMVTGWCLHDLGRSREAVDLLGAQLAAVPAHGHRTRARIGVRYALALVSAGELQQGCAVLDGVLDAALLADSATARVDLRRLAQELSRRSDHPPVKRLMPRMITALSTAYR